MKPLLGFILGMLLFMGCKESVDCEREIYLIPEGFRGKIIVFFDQQDGQEKQFENEARLYRIPPSGYLKSQFAKNVGCMGDNRIQFYYEQSNGERQPLDYFLNIDRDSIPKEKDYVMFTFLSDKSAKPDFVIHCIGELREFNELTQSVRYLKPVEILDSL